MPSRGRRSIAQGKKRQYYVYRGPKGKFQDWVSRGKSQKRDMRKKVPRKGLRSGYGHRADHPIRRR